MKIKRYVMDISLKISNQQGVNTRMIEDPQGEWIKYEDYQDAMRDVQNLFHESAREFSSKILKFIY